MKGIMRGVFKITEKIWALANVIVGLFAVILMSADPQYNELSHIVCAYVAIAIWFGVQVIVAEIVTKKEEEE